MKLRPAFLLLTFVTTMLVACRAPAVDPPEGNRATPAPSSGGAGGVLGEKARAPSGLEGSPRLATDTAAIPAVPETCYELSSNGRWSHTPEVLCVAADGDRFALIMRTGIDAQEVGRLHFDLLDRVKCADCNKDLYGMADPTNTVFNVLKVKFDGKRDVKTGGESGKLSIGATALQYRLIKSTPKKP